jgi:hypothetical protein
MKHLKWVLMAVLFFVMLAPVQINAAGFTDVSTSHWANKSITKLTNAKIINGYGNGKFMPEENVTRAQAAILLAESLNISLETNYKPSYKDVEPSSGAYKQIAVLTEKGIFSNSTKF